MATSSVSLVGLTREILDTLAYKDLQALAKATDKMVKANGKKEDMKTQLLEYSENLSSCSDTLDDVGDEAMSKPKAPQAPKAKAQASSSSSASLVGLTRRILDTLAYKDLQALAKATDKVVKANGKKEDMKAQLLEYSENLSSCSDTLDDVGDEVVSKPQAPQAPNAKALAKPSVKPNKKSVHVVATQKVAETPAHAEYATIDVDKFHLKPSSRLLKMPLIAKHYVGAGKFLGAVLPGSNQKPREYEAKVRSDGSVIWVWSDDCPQKRAKKCALPPSKHLEVGTVMRDPKSGKDKVVILRKDGVHTWVPVKKTA